MSNILFVSGCFEFVLGLILLTGFISSILAPEEVLKLLLGAPSFGPLVASSWAQAAVAFGMHSYADLYSGYQMILCSKKMDTRLPRLVTAWNTTRFAISLLWLLKFSQGYFKFHQTNFDALVTGKAWGLVLIGLLAIDGLLNRPAAIFVQRRLEDMRPQVAVGEGLSEYMKMTPIQKFCRGVFYYEAVISGLSGATYFVMPDLFTTLYGYPASDVDFVALWSLSQFGCLVLAFGLYQQQTEIDDNTGMIIWWLLLDYVWLYVFWQGTAERLGPWNPFLFQGANFWCHSAWHADSSLALARMIFLGTLLTSGRGAKKLKEG